MTSSPVTASPTGCFAASSLVQLESGETVTLRDLRHGDRVMTLDMATGLPTFNTAYDFTSMHRNKTMNAVHITTEDQATISLSGVHMLFVSVTPYDPPRDMQAKHIKPGMFLWGASKNKPSQPLIVTNVDKRLVTGLSAPLTESGTIVVNGLLASCYTRSPHHVFHALYGLNQVWRHWFPRAVGSEADGPKITVCRYLADAQVGEVLGWAFGEKVGGNDITQRPSVMANNAGE
jgi:hypothetical protein